MGKTEQVPAGELDQRVEVLELFEEDGGYGWRPIRRPWAKVELSPRKNVYSVHGIGAAGVTVILRHQPLSVENALRWRDRHCFITSIQPMGRAFWRVEAALVELSQCEDRHYSGVRFPAVMTEQYLKHEQLEPMAVNFLRHVLITPKAIRLKPGRLVVVDGEEWPIRVAHVLDPHKNEYELEREVDL